MSRFAQFVHEFGLSLRDFELDGDGNMVLTDEAAMMLESLLAWRQEEEEVYGG